MGCADFDHAFRIALGQRIAVAVLRSGQKGKAAAACGVTTEQLNKWINGTVKVPVEALYRLAGFADVNFSWLATGKEDAGYDLDGHASESAQEIGGAETESCHDVSLNLDTARAVIQNPQKHSVDDQRAACVWMMNHGDWLDYERAVALLRVVLRDWDAAEQRRVEARTKHALKWLIIGMLVAAVGLWIGVLAEKTMSRSVQAALAAEWAVP